MNKRFTYYMWHAIPRHHVKDLVSRVLQGLVLMVAIYTCIKHFPLVYVSLVSNLAPLLTALLSYIIFNVGISRLDTAILILSFLGVILLITGDPDIEKEESKDDQTNEFSNTFWNKAVPTILLILIPILSASVTLFIRQLKSLSEISIGALITFGIIVIYGPVAYFMDNGYGIFLTFDQTDLLLGLGLGVTSSVVQIAKNKALQYEEPARLVVLMYFTSVLQLILDVLFLNTPFTSQQIIGVMVIFGSNSIKWGTSLKQIWTERYKQK